MLSLRSDAILKHQIMISVYFLIGLKVDWLSNSKHPLFYLKIQPGEPLPFLNCFANWLLGKVITSTPRDRQPSSALGEEGGGAEELALPSGSCHFKNHPFAGLSRPCMHISISMPWSQLRLPERTLCDHWLLFWPPLWEKGWGCCPEPWRRHQTSQAQYFCCSYQANEQSVQSLGSTFSFLLTLWTSFFHHILWYGHPFP